MKGAFFRCRFDTLSGRWFRLRSFFRPFVRSLRLCRAARPARPAGPLILATVGISRGADLRIEVWKTQEEAVTRLVTGDAAAIVLPVTVGAAYSAKADIVLLGAFRESVFSLIVRGGDGWENLRGREILVAQGAVRCSTRSCGASFPRMI